MMTNLGWILTGSTVIVWLVAAWLLVNVPIKAAEKPFNVYETEGACVYVAGADRTAIGIAVIPKSVMGRNRC